MGVSRMTVDRWAASAGLDLNMGAIGGVTPLPMDAEPPQTASRSYRRLTLADRSFIQAALTMPEPLSMRRIAAELGVSASTISREVRAHSVTDWGEQRYSADVAHYRALHDRPRSRIRKLDDPQLRGQVIDLLNLKYSPEQVAAELKIMFPDRKEMHISHESIYQELYVQGRGALRHELTVVKALRTGRSKRMPRSKLPARNTRPWLDGARLSDRPAEVNDRAVPGHWEGDLVVGRENSGLVTLVERSSRYVLIGHLPGCRDSATVIDVLERMIEGLPADLVRTITWDQRQEMAQHATFTVATGCRVFFCDPHSPWQQGSNENTNGLIRDFYPKGTNFGEITDADLTEVQRLLNIRPRKTLGWRKPCNVLSELIAGVALAS
ncbi:IS30 family transposase [Rhodococcus zopfii]|uniref:IS30 family transposase n=1 Tax=Rhodococcus zopfii TaxID=43772 RepID=A0ABU3WQA9_9NOCA|nr:IS30 family transposase [Rhodococcus zopfii]